MLKRMLRKQNSTTMKTTLKALRYQLINHQLHRKDTWRRKRVVQESITTATPLRRTLHQLSSPRQFILTGTSSHITIRDKITTNTNQIIIKLCPYQNLIQSKNTYRDLILPHFCKKVIIIHFWLLINIFGQKRNTKCLLRSDLSLKW